MLTIPDEGAGVADVQSVLYSAYLNAILAGCIGTERVLSGGAVTSNSNMAPSVAKGSALSGGVLFGWAANTVTVTTAHATLPRIDLIVATTGGLAVRAGTAASPPAPPTPTAGDVLLAAVYVAAADTSIGSTEMQDMRMSQSWGPVCLDRNTTQLTINNDATAQTYYTITLPSGLFLANRVLDLRMTGDMLINSGTPTVTITAFYGGTGGTTMWSDVSGTFTAQAARRPWELNLRLTAQGNAVQICSAIFGMVPVGGNVAPATGTGDVWGSNSGTPIRGAAALDSDSANRDLVIQMTMSVANAANEIRRESATALLW